MDSDSEFKLISLLSKLNEDDGSDMSHSDWERKVVRLILQIVSLVVSMDSESQPKPESKLMSLVTEAISLYDSIDFDSLPEPLWDLISLIDDHVFDEELKLNSKKFRQIVSGTLRLEQEPRLISLCRQIVSVVSIESKKILVVCPKEEVSLKEGEHSLLEDYITINFRWDCFFGRREEYIFIGRDEVSYLNCRGCKGEYHNEYEKVPQEIIHPLHPRHSLHLVSLEDQGKTRDCYCCDEHLEKAFYYCSSCDYAMNITCAEKTPLLSRDHPKWHEHKLLLFPSMASLPCNVCALTHSLSPFYVCPPCDFVVHENCLSLPRIIRISRHRHRISFTKSFNQGELSCGVCRRKIDNDYGGYSCIKDDCAYVAHSRCATQTNVWDGIDLEGTPEEIEEEVEPFERISDGIIRHFSHKHHHLRLEESKCKDYDEDILCQACISPIYLDNFYTCDQCEFVLHEKCANLLRKVYHPTHPHLLTLTLVGENVDLMDDKNKCSVCYGYVTNGFVYKCGEEECHFRLDMSCALLSEPLAHESHEHLLFLTSKPGEKKVCSLCPIPEETLRIGGYFLAFFKKQETFNCIECDGFSVCFECASVPTKVRYKHDGHTLTLCHGEAKRSMEYWCEICEEQIMEKRFYMCDEYCCVTLHIECFTGQDLYMKPGSSFFYEEKEINVMPNNHNMSRPVCFTCKKRCPQKIVFQCSGSIFCTLQCLDGNL